MTYRALPEPLRPVADGAAKFLRVDRGLPPFKIETAIADNLDRPTLHSVSRDHHYVCIEASERNGLQPNVERFVADCMRLSIPVRLYVAVTAGEGDKHFDRMLARARDLGLGILEVDGEHVTARQEPLPLSLLGVRRQDRSTFPARYREALALAEQTFLSGDPAKGCAGVYDNLEALSRKLAEHTYKAGLWKSRSPAANAIGLKFDKAPWASVMKEFVKELDGTKLPTVSEALIHGIAAVTSHRNDTGHKVKNKKDLIKRDTQLRTRFEHAVDLFRELVAAAKPFRI